MYFPVPVRFVFSRVPITHRILSVMPLQPHGKQNIIDGHSGVAYAFVRELGEGAFGKAILCKTNNAEWHQGARYVVPTLPCQVLVPSQYR